MEEWTAEDQAILTDQGYERVDAPMALTALLRRMAYGQRLLTVTVNASAPPLAVRAFAWDAETAELLADWPEGAPAVDAVCEFVSLLDSIRYRFRAAIRIDGTDRHVRVRVPTRMYRLQRRDDYRLVAGCLGRLLGTGWLAGQQVTFEVLDLSAGGIRLAVPAAVEAGAALTRCRMELPAEGLFEFDLVVRHVEAAAPPLMVVGCVFVRFATGTREHLSRYLIARQRTERSDVD